MLGQILDHLHNYFVVKGGVHTGTFTVADGSIDLDFLQPGQYFKIVGSVFNDGTHQYPATDLTAETFSGEIWAMAVPPAVIALAAEIGEWVGKYGDTMNSPFSSESFGGYSYSKAQGYAGAGGGMLSSWQSVFANRLNMWRKPS